MIPKIIWPEVSELYGTKLLVKKLCPIMVSLLFLHMFTTEEEALPAWMKAHTTKGQKPLY